MFYLHKINLYFIVGVNQCRRNSASPIRTTKICVCALSKVVEVLKVEMSVNIFEVIHIFTNLKTFK